MTQNPTDSLYDVKLPNVINAVIIDHIAVVDNFMSDFWFDDFARSMPITTQYFRLTCFKDVLIE